VIPSPLFPRECETLAFFKQYNDDKDARTDGHAQYQTKSVQVVNGTVALTLRAILPAVPP
jgi:hypothetical protein